MTVSSSQNRFLKAAKSASGAPGLKSAPRGSKSTTFGKGLFQLVNLRKIAINPMRDPSVLPFQFPIYTNDSKLQLEKFRNWRLVSCELHVDTDFEMYGSSIGVCNWVCNDTQVR